MKCELNKRYIQLHFILALYLFNHYKLNLILAVNLPLADYTEAARKMSKDEVAFVAFGSIGFLRLWNLFLQISCLSNWSLAAFLTEVIVT